MNFLQIIVLAFIQGMAELLPISSSAHVIVAEKLMGINPTRPEMTLFLVMLHTGTMFSVLIYFWNDWKKRYFQSSAQTWLFIKQLVLATFATGMLGIFFLILIEKVILRHSAHPQVESLFGNLTLMSISLVAGGILILYAAWKQKKHTTSRPLGFKEALWIGLIQGLALPFRGFSRSGATISLALIFGIDKMVGEEFSFALALLLTPPVILREVYRVLKIHLTQGISYAQLGSLFYPSLFGMIFSFLAGLLALKWLSSWLKSNRWGIFGVYCLFAAVVVFGFHLIH
jgi:undecaprenyl-diphosphatase